MAKLQIDIDSVPFSRRGSYLAFRRMQATDRTPVGLYLRSVDSGSAGHDRLLLVEVVRSGRTLRFDVQASATVMRLRSAAGWAEICFASPEDIRLRGKGIALRVSQDWTSNAVTIPGPEDQWRFIAGITGTKLLFTALSGSLSVNAPWIIAAPSEKGPPPRHENPRFAATFAPATEGGKFEGNIHAYRSEPARRRSFVGFGDCLREVEADWQDWLGRTPAVPRKYASARKLAAYTCWSSMVNPRGNFDRRLMLMSKNAMAACWPWDACFNAMALARTAPKVAWDQFTYHLEMQDADGAVPDKVSSREAVWSFTKPPVHGWILRWMMKRSSIATPRRLERLYQLLAKATQWWLNYRDDGRTGLCQYHHGNDCGWDNATTFDAGLPLRAADLAAWLAIQMDVLAEIARRIGRSADQRKWRAKSRRMIKTMMKLWRDGKFVALYGPSGQVAGGELSLFNYVPIVLGERLSPQVAAKMAADLKREGFLLTEHGLATESPASPHYCGNGYWRGPIWAPSTMIMVDGLSRAGEHAFAKDLARRFCDMCAANGFAENYNAISGEGLCDPAYTWTASVFLVLAHEYL